MSRDFALRQAEEQIDILRSALLESETENAALKRENEGLRSKYEYAVNPCALISQLENIKAYFGLMSVHSEGANHNATLVSLLHQLKRIREDYKALLTAEESE